MAFALLSWGSPSVGKDIEEDELVSLSSPTVEKAIDEDELFIVSSLGGLLFGKATDEDELISSFFPNEGLANDEDELVFLSLCGLPVATDELELGSGKKQVTFPIKVKERVCQFLQVVDCTTILPITMRHISWPSKDDKAHNNMSTQNQPSGILPLKLHHKILSSKKAASLNQMVRRSQYCMEKGEPSILFFKSQ